MVFVGLVPDKTKTPLVSNTSERVIEIADNHHEVIQMRVRHYRDECQQHDCCTASPHMYCLVDHFSDQSGSGYLFRL